MQIIKLYQKPNKPEYMHLVRRAGNSILVNSPWHLKYGLRTAKWLDLDAIYVDWIRQFLN